MGSRKAAPRALCTHSAGMARGAARRGKVLGGRHSWGPAVCMSGERQRAHTAGVPVGEGKQKRNPSVGRAAIVGSEVTQQRTAAPSANALLQGNVTGYNALPLLKRPFLTKNYEWKYNKRSYFASAVNNCVPQRKKNPH